MKFDYSWILGENKCLGIAQVKIKVKNGHSTGVSRYLAKKAQSKRSMSIIPYNANSKHGIRTTNLVSMCSKILKTKLD